MRTNFKRACTGVAALTAGFGAVLVSPAALNAAPAGTPQAAPAAISPTSGSSTTVLELTAPDGAFCPGDTASDGYQWSTFLTPATIDPATLTYDFNGPVSQAGEFTFPFFTPAGTPIAAKNTAPDSGFITGNETASFEVFGGAVPAGDYIAGIACYVGGQTEKFWSIPITVDANNGYTITPTSPPVSILPSGGGIQEGDAGSKVAQVPVRLSEPSDVTVTVDWATVDTSGQTGSPTPGTDFVAASGTLTFAPGQTEAFVPVSILGDTDAETPLLWGEWGLIEFSNPTNGVIDEGPFFGLGLFIILDERSDS